jgi:protein-S-isoprenylcysteine O-methyltransferase Ste14
MTTHFDERCSDLASAAEFHPVHASRNKRPTAMLRSVLRTLAAFGIWAVVHSLLATDRVKGLAAIRLGENRRNGIYRLGYNAVAVITLTGLVLYVHRLPDRPLYRIRWPWRGLTGTLRLAFLAVMASAALELGLGPFSGVSELVQYLVGQTAQREPEAQGPALHGTALTTGGPFRYLRHPLNACAAAVVLLTPTMTVVRLTAAGVTVTYALVGSWLEERRLIARYGALYQQYRDAVPFFLPSLR